MPPSSGPPPIGPTPSSGSGLTKKAGPFPVWLWLLVILVLIIGGVVFAVAGGGDDEDGGPATVDPSESTDRSDRTDPDESTTDGTQPDETGPDVTVGETVFVTVPPTADESAPTFTLPVVTTPPTDPDTTDSDLPYELALTEQWFYPTSNDFYEYGGIIENLGTQTATGFIEIEIDFFDDTDRILSTESAFVQTVIPGVRTPFTGILIDSPATPVRMEVRLADDNFIDADPDMAGDITVANVATADDGFEFVISGDATSTFGVDLEFVQLVALWRDANGAVVFTAGQYLERVPAGSTTTFSISTFDEIAPRTAPTEILFTT